MLVRRRVIRLSFQFIQRICEFQQIEQAPKFELCSYWRVEEIRTCLQWKKNI